MARFLVTGLHYAPEPLGNAPYTTAYAEALAAAGHRVDVVTGYPHYPEWTSDRREWRWRTELVNGVRVHRVPHLVPSTPDAKGRLLLEASYGLATLPEVARRSADAVIGVIPTLSGGLAARLAGFGRRKPVGLLVQDLVSAAAAHGGVPGASPRIASAVGAVERRIVRGAHVVVVARGFEEPVVAAGARSVTYAPNFTTLAAAPTRPREETRARLGVAPDAFVVGYSGNLGFKQDFDTVIAAATLLRDEPDVCFLVVGEGSQRERLATAIADGRMRGVLQPLQPSEEVPAVLDAADVLLAPQRPTDIDMSIPSKLTAYFASGRPVVAAASPASETAAQVTTSCGGLVVPPEDPQALAEAIRSLRAQEPLREALGAAGRAYALDVFDRGRAEARFVAWAEDLAARRLG
ncbi:MAG: glycosyltransferase [Dehalococcoidia bacterium]|nr:glycosyltransferase [Dehalococcoidia bacterium]